MGTFRTVRSLSRRGFSLIEVLIAVLILALGLLGLGAIFPVVIREQRAGTDATTSVLAARAAEAYMLGAPAGSPRIGDEDLNPRFWREVRDDLGNGADDGGLGQYTVISMPVGGGAFGPSDVDFNGWHIPLSERLYPPPDTGLEPQYVWDFAFGRATDPRTSGTSDHDGVRIAMFLRRIDSRMRLPQGRSLRSALLDPSVPGLERRVPIASDRNNVPTYDGIGEDRGRYSELTVQAIQFVFDPSSANFKFRDRIYRATPPPGSGPSPVRYWDQLAQVGQQFVDNLGNIYTVTQVGITGNTPWVKVDPPVPASVTEDRAAATPGGFGADELIRQAVFSSQIPAGVRVFTVPVEEQ